MEKLLAIILVLVCCLSLVASMCTVGITIATKACVNTRRLMTVNTAPSTSAVNQTAITADGPILNIVRTISDFEPFPHRAYSNYSIHSGDHNMKARDDLSKCKSSRAF